MTPIPIDKSTYEEALEEAQLSVFDPLKHPRDPLTGRFRKGMRVVAPFFDALKTGKVKNIDRDRGVVDVDFDDGHPSVKMYSRGLRPVAEQIPEAKDIKDATTAMVWGIHKGTDVELGDKLEGHTINEIVQVLDRMEKDDPEVFYQLGSIKAASALKSEDRGFDWRTLQSDPIDFLEGNPKTVMMTHVNALLEDHPTELIINDLHHADAMNKGDMRRLTNPKGDKKVSPAHKTLGGIVAHEMGHALWDSDESVAEEAERRFKEVKKRWLQENVSYRASLSPEEMLSEIYALKFTKHKIPRELQGLV